MLIKERPAFISAEWLECDDTTPVYEVAVDPDQFAQIVEWLDGRDGQYVWHPRYQSPPYGMIILLRDDRDKIEFNLRWG